MGVKQGETHFGLIDNAYYIYDFEANRSRDCIETDIADKLLVLDSSLTNIEYDCCNLFTTLGRGIGSPVVSTYDSSEACERLRSRPDARVGPVGTGASGARLSERRGPIHRTQEA